jgi:hypothetical protein
MSEKEKAKELVDKFARIDGYDDSIDLSKCEYEKQCALIAIERSVAVLKFLHGLKPNDTYISYYLSIEENVKTEIEKL